MSIENSADFVGVSDDYQRLWVPHRMVYVKDEENRGRENQLCPFCEAISKSDEESLIIYRGKTAYVIMNLFPYNTGHIMVLPYRHFAFYEDASIEEREEISSLSAQTLKAIRKGLKSDGFNIGINQGEVAGAGIAAHLHQHIVPRWNGDSNFFPIIAKTKALPTLLEETRQRIVNAW